MKNLKYSLVILGCMLMLVSCNDFLDVQPEDKFLEEDVFNNETGIQTVLNGIYTNMTSQATYGGNLTMSTVELFGQRFNLTADGHQWTEYGDYNYDDSGVQSNVDAIWSNTYINILNINNFIVGLETYEGVLTEEKSNLLKGEAIGLRAMLHFDLLRLFGPIYNVSSQSDAIPYYTDPTADLNPILPANEVMQLILEDLNMAEQLLANDPIRDYGKIAVLEEDSFDLLEGQPGFGYEGTNFYRFRNLRLNFYAVKALQARVNLYGGNNPAALSAAKFVIDEASQWFPWTSPFAIISSNPDRIFSSEVLFGVQNTNIATRYNSYYSDALTATSILTAHPTQLALTFEGNQNDYRFNSTWIIPSNGNHPFRTFYKYSNITADQQFMQPLIKISEMYYIAAETEPDPALAIQYLNTVRFNRGLVNLSPGVDIQNEIYKEYRKEFFGEGQLFFYHKRKNFPQIPNGSSSSGTIPMNSETYVVPLPISETAYN